MKKNVFYIGLIIGFTVLVAALGGYFVNTASPWYNSLTLPSFMPSSVVFIGAWTLIYIFTAAAAILTVLAGDYNLLYAYGINGVANALWTYVFFAKENIALGLFIIGFLILNVIYIISKSTDKRSKILLVPYLFWLLVAAILNYSILMLN